MLQAWAQRAQARYTFERRPSELKLGIHSKAAVFFFFLSLYCFSGVAVNREQ